MRTNSIATYLVALSVALAAAPALAQSEEALSVAQRLVVRSGISVQLRGFAQQVIAQIEQQRGKVPDTMVPALADAAREAFRPELLQDDIVEGFAKRLKVDEMKVAIAWLETDVGKRVTLAEELASATADEASIQAYAERMKQKKPSAARTRLVNDIIAASYAEDSTVRGLQAAAVGVAYGMDSMQPAQKRMGMARIQAHVKAALPPERLKEALRATLHVTYFYTYRDIGDKDLVEYLAFLRTPTGKRYSEEAMEAFMDALVRASIRLGQLVDPNSSKRPT